MIFVIGWIGALCFAFCAVPQVVKTYRSKSIGDFSWGFLILWIAGEILCGYYVVCTTGLSQAPLLANYLANGLMLGYLVYAKVRY